MTDTTFTSRLLGSAWPGYFNKPIAEAMYENIKKVGLPQWSEDDQTLAKALQNELKVPVKGLATKIRRAARAARADGDADGEGGERRAHGRRLGRYRRRLLGRADRDAALSRPIFRAGPATTGRTRSRWRRRSRTKAWSRAPRCRR